MREGRANGGAGPASGGADAAPAPTEAVRRRMKPESHPSASGSAASSSSGGGAAAAEEEERGGRNNRQGRRRSRRREEVVRAIRDRLPAAPSCWGGNVSVVQERRGRRGRPGDVDRGGGGGNAVQAEEEEEEGSAPGRGRGPGAAEWCCLCPEGDDCSLEPNPSANGKEDPGLRSLLERNDFYSADCNPHAPAAAAANGDGDDLDGDQEAGPAADFE